MLLLPLLVQIMPQLMLDVLLSFLLMCLFVSEHLLYLFPFRILSHPLNFGVRCLFLQSKNQINKKFPGQSKTIRAAKSTLNTTLPLKPHLPIP